LVGKIPPSADTLRKEQSHDDTIARAEEIHLFDDTYTDNACRATDNTADNRQAALSNGFKREPFFYRHITCDTVEKPRRKDSDRQTNTKERQEQIRRHIPTAKEQGYHEKRRNHTANDNNRIRVNIKPEYSDMRIIGVQKPSIVHCFFS
jgi:hypothetical protein